MSNPVGLSPTHPRQGLRAAFKRSPRQHPAPVPVHDQALHPDRALRLDQLTQPEAVAQRTAPVMPALLARLDLPALAVHVTLPSQGLPPVRYS